MKKIFVLLVLVVFLASCGYPIKPGDKDSINIVSNITYVLDTQTGICFAVVGSRSSDGLIVYSATTVPFEKIEGKVRYVKR
jgi:hypothetical protein